MSSAVAFRSAPTTTARSASLSLPIETNHDRRNNLSASHQIDADRSSPVAINGAVTTALAGILYERASCFRGWKRRWFVLQDGVLSYHKIHGRNKISLVDTVRPSMVIGGQSLQIISQLNKRGDVNCAGKPLGEIHLKVASILQSRSDGKRFSIFTGTKWLHLRAATPEDCTAWLEGLDAVKAMFPRMSDTHLMAPAENLSISTDKLRRRLVHERVNQTAIEDCEEIMRNEFAALQNQVVMLKHKQRRLTDTLKNIEVHARKLHKSKEQCRSRNLP